MARKASRTTPNLASQSLRGAGFERARSSVVLGADVRDRRRGFTIVELLIVVVVIAILAAITIVAYNGITNRSKAAAALTAAEQAAKKVMTYAVTNSDQYPTALTDAGVTDGSASYQYRVDNSANPRTFCVTATTQNVSYWVSSASQTPNAGACAGHAAPGQTLATNLNTNPSAEANDVNFGGVNGATSNRQTGAAIFGSFGIRVTTPSGGAADSGAAMGVFNVTTGQTITYSVSVRAITAGTFRLSLQGAAAGGNLTTTITLAANEVGRISSTLTPPATGVVQPYLLRTGTAIATFDVDGVMIASGSGNATFADGSTPGWAWNGTPNNSTSTGPAP